MKPGDLHLKTTTSRLTNFVLSDKATRNHPGEGLSDDEDQSQPVMTSWLRNPRCPVASLGKFLAKRDSLTTRCPLAENHNASAFYSVDEVWFFDVPIGKHRLVSLLIEVCQKAGHTSITVLKATGLENCRAKSVTGHASNKSIKS